MSKSARAAESLVVTMSGCMPRSNTSVPRGCSTANAGTGMRMRPFRPVIIVAESVVNQPHSSGRTRTVMRAQ
jgi:hypothetical protein